MMAAYQEHFGPRFGVAQDDDRRRGTDGNTGHRNLDISRIAGEMRQTQLLTSPHRTGASTAARHEGTKTTNNHQTTMNERRKGRVHRTRRDTTPSCLRGSWLREKRADRVANEAANQIKSDRPVSSR